MDAFIRGRYELLEEVAEGPVARLHRGCVRGDAGFARTVAVRELRAELGGDGRFLSTWAAAAAALAEAPSPHVEQVLDVVEEGGRELVISEWVEGVSVRRFLDAHRERDLDVPWPAAAEIALAALRGLSEPHAREPKLRHDGIGPEALRIARDGTVKLTRFGVAPALAAMGMGRRRMEELGLRHPAPELVDGGDADAATEVFGVGVLLYHLLAGESPYEIPVGAQRDMVVKLELPDLSGQRPDLPPLLLASMERAVRLDPSERFLSVDRMARALTQVLRTHPGPTGPTLLEDSIRTLFGEWEPVPVTEPTPAEVRPRGLPQASTMHVDMEELTELLPPPIGPQRTKPYQFDYKKRVGQAEGLTHIDSEAEPLPLTTRSGEHKLGLRPAKTEMIAEGELDALTIDGSEAQVSPDEAPASKEKRPTGIGQAKTEYLEDGELEQLRIPDE